MHDEYAILKRGLNHQKKRTDRLDQIVNSWQGQMSGKNLDRTLRRGTVEGTPLCTDRYDYGARRRVLERIVSASEIDDERRDPTLADLLFQLTFQEVKLFMVVEMARTADRDDVKRSTSRAVWLRDRIENERACVMPLVVGTEWADDILTAFDQWRVPLIKVKLEYGEKDIGGYRPPSGVKYVRERLLKACIECWAGAIL